MWGASVCQRDRIVKLSARDEAVRPCSVAAALPSRTCMLLL